MQTKFPPVQHNKQYTSHGVPLMHFSQLNRIYTTAEVLAHLQQWCRPSCPWATPDPSWVVIKPAMAERERQKYDTQNYTPCKSHTNCLTRFLDLNLF